MSDCDCGCKILNYARGGRFLPPYPSGPFDELPNRADQDSLGPHVRTVTGSTTTWSPIDSALHTATLTYGATLSQQIRPAGVGTFSAAGVSASIEIANVARTKGELWPLQESQFPAPYIGINDGLVFDYQLREAGFVSVVSQENAEDKNELPHRAAYLSHEQSKIRIAPDVKSDVFRTPGTSGQKDNLDSEVIRTPLTKVDPQITLAMQFDDASETGLSTAYSHARQHQNNTFERFSFPPELRDVSAFCYLPDSNINNFHTTLDRPQYFNQPMCFRGSNVTLFRNDEQVFQGINPTKSESLAAASADGHYLIASTLAPPLTAPSLGELTLPRVPVSLWSFVIDREPWSLGASPYDDFWDDRPVFFDNRIRTRDVITVSTKPLRDFPVTTGGNTVLPVAQFLPQDDTEVVRPLRGSVTDGRVPAVEWKTAQGVSLNNLPVGDHVVTLDSALFFDRAGNSPSYVPSVPIRRHAAPANNRRGAVPRLEDVGLQTREYYRPRRSSEPVRTARVTFDRKVRADTVTGSQVRLTRNDEEVEGCTIAQQSDTEWLITLPNVEQDSKSFWVLTYDPSGEVMTDDITEEVFARQSFFPPIDAAVYRKVYVDQRTGRRWSKSPTGYVEVGSGQPRDENGVPFEPEPSVIATRVGWLMADFNGWREPSDHTRRSVLIGTVPSVSVVLDERPEDDRTTSFEAQNISGSGSTFASSCSGNDLFFPQVPSATGPAWPLTLVATGPTGPTVDDCSYFGLRTTIHPCPPREVTLCALPRAAQRHASVIRSEQDILAINISAVYLDGTQESSVQPPVTSGTFRHPDVFPRLGVVTLQNTFQGDTLAQNVWAKETAALAATSADTLGFQTDTVDGGTVFLEAFRWATEYTAIKTAYLNMLEMVLRYRFRRSGDGYTGFQYFDDRLVFSLQQEDDFVAGSPVYFRRQRGGWAWKLQLPGA